MNTRPLLARAALALGIVGAFTRAMPAVAAPMLSGEPVQSTQVQRTQIQGALVREKNPTGKLYVVGVEGPTTLTQDGKIVPLTLKAVFPAPGAELLTKSNGTLSLVFSNGTGVFVAHDTKLDIKQFIQDPFTANRTDLEIEPSVSHTKGFIPHGTVAISTSKLLAKSMIEFETPFGWVALHDGNLVIIVNDTSVKYALLVGEAVVYAGPKGENGQVLHAGEQVLVRFVGTGVPNTTELGRIPTPDLPTFEAMVAQAYAARRTVYFETDGAGEISAFSVVPVSVPVNASVSPSKLPN